MTATETAGTKWKRRGRPRVHKLGGGLVRRNLLVEPDALRKLCVLYGTTSESEAIRRAVDLALLADEAHTLGETLAARGGPVDVYGRTTGAPRLPIHLRPEDVADADRETYANPSG